jgi:hypothetical protein
MQEFLSSPYGLGSPFRAFPDCSNRHGFIESHFDLSRSDRPDALRVVGSRRSPTPRPER